MHVFMQHLPIAVSVSSTVHPVPTSKSVVLAVVVAVVVIIIIIVIVILIFLKCYVYPKMYMKRTILYSSDHHAGIDPYIPSSSIPMAPSLASPPFTDPSLDKEEEANIDVPPVSVTPVEGEIVTLLFFCNEFVLMSGCGSFAFSSGPYEASVAGEL